jgi:cell division protein FtsI/penicillin-binding protein 2
MIVFGIILVRAFYLQIIRHEYYKQTANVGHLKEYEIQAQRGVIKAHDGSAVVPIVLDQTMYTVYADPTMIKDASKVAETLSSILKGDTSEYEAKLKSEDTRYVVLARKVSKQDKEALLKKKYPGLGAQEQQVRTYPNGSLAAQVLGFVNNEGKGVYGIEQELNGKLAGTNGQLKAVTDVHGVPLAANTDNILKNAVPGSDVVLTIDVAMQRQLEQLLKSGLERAKSDQGSALIMDVKNGDIKAMANWPTYDPTNYGDVEDANVFNNASVSHPIEVGSVMKPLTMAAALNENAVQPNTTYYDPAKFEIDDFTITNIEEDGGPGTKSMADLLNLSLNTGATWLLMRMSGNNDHITKAGRDKWHDYMTNHFMFGKPTGIEQGQDAEGSVPDPDKGYARDLTYANTSFGQAMTATPLQMAAAYTAVLNGGTYYKPRLVDSYISPDGKKTTLKPEVVKQNVVSPKVSQELQPLLEFVVDKHSFKRKFDQSTYSVGGKTGTAQIADHENGGYLADEFNGTYVGFVGGDEPQYVIAVSVIKPKIKGYAGSQAAQPLFGDLAHMLIDKFNVTPKIK